MTGTSTANPTPCAECPIRRLALFEPLSNGLLDLMQKHRLEQRDIPAGSLIYPQDARLDESFTVFQGWVMLHRTLSDGGRQVLRFALPGDFIGFQPDPESPVLHSAQALTAVRVCVFRQDSLMEMFREQPMLAIQMAWIASREEALAHDHMTSLGRRPAKERIAHLFLEIQQRMAAREPLDEHAGIPVPLKQEHIADALGLTTIHVNRTLRILREAGMVVLRGGMLRIQNRAALMEMTGFLPDSFRRRPIL